MAEIAEFQLSSSVSGNLVASLVMTIVIIIFWNNVIGALYIPNPSLIAREIEISTIIKIVEIFTISNYI